MNPAILHEKHPDLPGWWTWELTRPGLFNGALGPLAVRSDGPGRGVCRMILPGRAQANLSSAIHGGAIAAFLDVAMFAGGHMAGMSDTEAVTLSLSTQFVAAGVLGAPLDAHVELVRETGRLVFLRGTVMQGDEVVATFEGTLRKVAHLR